MKAESPTDFPSPSAHGMVAALVCTQPRPSAFRLTPLALALTLTFAGTAPLASAATTRPDGSILWIATNCNDAGSGSLRDAAAHAVAGDGVDLTALSCSTISVTSGAITLRDIELIGPGASRLKIDGVGNQDRRIFDHVSQGGRLTISGLTVSRGRYASNAGFGGGCLRSDGGTVTIRDSTFSGCIVVTPVGANGNARGGAIATYGDVELYGVTITGSLARTDHGSALGGGLYAQGDVSLDSSTITNNAVSASGSGAFTVGGGLFTRRFAAIRESTLDGNTSAGSGGGAVVERDALLLRSTVSNNSAVGGAAGIAILGVGNRRVEIYSSTISGNVTERSAAGLSGGLYLNAVDTSILNCTITGNRETNAVDTKFGAGIVFGPAAAQASLYGTIVSGNFFYDDATSFYASDITGPSSLAISGDTNLVGSSTRPLPLDTIFSATPKLGPLQHNGGPTRTHLPLPGSVAIDHGDAHGTETDQRGYPRVVGAAADIGAVEANPDDAIFADGFD